MLLTSLLALLPLVAGLTTPELRERSIYQVITDRFARPDGRLDAHCDPGERKYCGGGWKGIEHQLAYIQGMGFDTGRSARSSRHGGVLMRTVWISPIVANIPATAGSDSYHG